MSTLRQLLKLAALRDVLLPARHGQIGHLDPREVSDGSGRSDHLLAVKHIAGANFDLIQSVEYVQLGQRDTKRVK